MSQTIGIDIKNIPGITDQLVTPKMVMTGGVVTLELTTFRRVPHLGNHIIRNIKAHGKSQEGAKKNFLAILAIAAKTENAGAVLIGSPKTPKATATIEIRAARVNYPQESGDKKIYA